jgi:hypothetical protein
VDAVTGMNSLGEREVARPGSGPEVVSELFLAHQRWALLRDRPRAYEPFTDLVIMFTDVTFVGPRLNLGCSRLWEQRLAEYVEYQP